MHTYYILFHIGQHQNQALMLWNISKKITTHLPCPIFWVQTSIMSPKTTPPKKYDMVDVNLLTQLVGFEPMGNTQNYLLNLMKSTGSVEKKMDGNIIESNK